MDMSTHNHQDHAISQENASSAIPIRDGQEFVDYQSTQLERYPCYECKYKGDMPTKIFQSPENLELRAQGLPSRTAHYLCYYCATNRARYQNWTLLTNKVTVRLPDPTKDLRLACVDPSNPEAASITTMTEEEYDKTFDRDPVTGERLKTHYKVQQALNESIATHSHSGSRKRTKK